LEIAFSTAKINSNSSLKKDKNNGNFNDKNQFQYKKNKTRMIAMSLQQITFKRILSERFGFFASIVPAIIPKLASQTPAHKVYPFCRG
jgi:hypothetical protein